MRVRVRVRVSCAPGGAGLCMRVRARARVRVRCTPGGAGFSPRPPRPLPPPRAPRPQPPVSPRPLPTRGKTPRLRLPVARSCLRDVAGCLSRRPGGTGRRSDKRCGCSAESTTAVATKSACGAAAAGSGGGVAAVAAESTAAQPVHLGPHKRPFLRHGSHLRGPLGRPLLPSAGVAAWVDAVTDWHRRRVARSVTWWVHGVGACRVTPEDGSTLLRAFVPPQPGAVEHKPEARSTATVLSSSPGGQHSISGGHKYVKDLDTVRWCYSTCRAVQGPSRPL
jgi:hypothetical protein